MSKEQNLEEEIKNLCGDDEKCIEYLKENCPDFNGKYPSQADYYLVGRECLREYARQYKKECEGNSSEGED